MTCASFRKHSATAAAAARAMTTPTALVLVSDAFCVAGYDAGTFIGMIDNLRDTIPVKAPRSRRANARSSVEV